MRKTTFVKKLLYYIVLFVGLLIGDLNNSYSQCPTIANSTQTFCDTESPTVGSLVATDTGGGIVWYTLPSGGVPLSSSIPLNSGTTYYADNLAGNCVTRPSVTVTVFSKPIAVVGAIELCRESTVADLAPYVIGNNIRWYLTPTLGTALDPSTPIVNNTTYHASQTNPNTGCETSRRGFSVTINIVPTPTGDATQIFCSTSVPLVADLNVTGTNVLWYLTSNSGIEIDPATPLIDGRTYYAESNIGNCPSENRLAVLVQINNPNDAGVNDGLGICINNVATTPPINLFNILGGTPESTGIWTGPITTTNGNLGTVDVSSMNLAGSPYVFNYTVTNPPCPVATSTITITINPLPTVTVTIPPVCAGTPATVTANPTPAGTYNYAWTVPAGVTNPGNVASFTSTVAGTYTVIITNPTTTCPSLPASGTLTINPIPTVTVTIPPVCAGTPATVTANPTPAGTYNYAWTVPAGVTNPGNVASFTSTVAGTYTVIITNPTTTCPSLPASGTLTINPIPTVTVTIPPVCAGTPATVTANPTPAGTYNYAWTVPAGVTNPGNVASFTSTVAGTYTVIITNPTTTCPSLPASGTLTINPIPTVTVTIPPVCAGTPATVTANPTPAGTYNYAWTVPAGVTNPGNVASFTSTVAGTYTVIITNPTTTCPSLPASGTLTINPIPTVTVTIPPVCAGTPATVTANPTPAGTYNYAWTVPAGVTNPGNVASFTSTVAGTYTVIITNPTTTCPSLPASGTLTINPIPTVTVTIPPVCAGTPATVTANPTPAGTYNYAWTVPAGVTNPGNVASFTSTVAGTYTVIITNPTTTCPSLPASGTLTINPLPTVTVTIPPVCAGTPATVTANPTPAGTYNYAWTVPAGVTNPGNVASFTSTVAGTYTVIITNPTTTCPSLPASGTLTINPIPTVTVTIPPVCAGTPATVTANPTPAGTYNYAWTVPAGVTNPGNVASFTSTVAGTYTVIITNPTTTCPSLPASGTLTINPLPTVTVTIPPVCAGTPATVTANPTPAGTYNYAWTVPAGVTNPGNVASFTSTVAGTYTVIITNPTTTCPSLPASGTLTINPIPTVTVTIPPVCAGTPATVTANPTPAGTYNYAWTVPAGVTNPGNVASFTSTVAGTYTVIITNPTTTCPSLPASGTLTINPIPTVTVTIPPVCAGTPATVTANPTPAGTYNYAWTVPAGVTNPGNVASFTSTVAGTYTVIITNPTTTCPSLPASGTLTINPIPTVTVTIPPVCAGTPATVTANPTPAGTYNYAWTVPAGVTNPGNVASFTSTVAGTYTVIITNPTTTCPSLPASGTLTINPIPTVTVTIPPVCAGTPATVTANPTPAGTYNYAWTVPAGVTNPGNVASFTSTVAGTYTVIITNPTTTCPSLPASGTLTINPIPTVTVTIPPVCAGTPATVTANPTPAGTYNYAWTVPAGVTNPGNVASFTSTVAGTYTVIITNPTTTCPSLPASGTLTINLPPNAGVDNNLTICSNQNPVDLFTLLGPTAQAGGTWSPALASGTGVFNPAVDPAGNYTYTVTGITPCPNATSEIVVQITPGPEAGVSTNYEPCENSPTQDLFLLLGPTAQPGGVWTDALNNVVTGIFNPATDTGGVYTYTLTGANPCDNDFATVTIIVNPVPNAGDDNSTTICTNDSPLDLFTLLGANAQTGGTWFPPLASGTGVFNPAIDLGGIYTYTVGGTACTPDSAQIVVTLLQSPIAGVDGVLETCEDEISVDLTTGLDGTQGVGTWTDDDGTGALTGDIFNPSIAGPGIYNFTYTVGGGTAPCLFDTATVTVTVLALPNAGTAVLINPICNSLGTLDLNTLLNNEDTGGTWIDDTTNLTVTNPLDISNLSVGPHSYTYSVTNTCDTASQQVSFEILPNPELENTNISIDAICVGSDATVNFTGMIDGTYTVTFDLTGSNVLVNQTQTITVVSGGANFTIPASSIPNSGSTTIAFTTILNTITSCEIILNNISATIDINPTVSLENDNIIVDPICLGNDIEVTIENANNLPDGIYQFDYAIPNATPNTGNSGDVVITGGEGEFTISGTNIPLIGSYTLTITAINTSTGCSNPTEDASTNFIVNPIPDTSGLTILVDSACVNTDTLVVLTGGAGIIDGSYTLDYQLSGASTTSGLGLAVFTNGNAQFILPGTSLTNIGSTTITINSITSDTTNCSATTNNLQATFDVFGLPTAFNATDITIPVVCVGNDATVTINNLLEDGTFTLYYDLTGNNTLAGQTTTVVVNGGTTSFTIPAANLTNTGSTNITFTTIQNTTTSCQITLTNVIGEIEINPLIELLPTTVSIADVCVGSDATVVISGALNLPDGDYQIGYTIPNGTPTTGNSGTINIINGNVQFTIPTTMIATATSYTVTFTTIISATECSNLNEDTSVTFNVLNQPNAGTSTSIAPFCPTTGTFDLSLLLDNEQTGGTWTDVNGVTVTSPIDISTFGAGTYSYTYTITTCTNDTETVSFTILQAPLLNTGNVAIAPVCSGNDVTVNLSGMIDGNYSLNFDLTGSNSATGQSVNISVVAGTASFVIPTTVVPNIGLTTITFTSIVNTTSLCQTFLTNVSASIRVNPIVQLDNANLAISNVCQGNDAIVTIQNATDLPDGNYQFTYSIPNGTPNVVTTANVTITGGNGEFTIPATVINTATSYTLTITNIITSVGCSNQNENASANFVVNALPNPTGVTIDAPDACANFDLTVTITGATNLANGNYGFDYQLSGTNTTSGFVTFDITNGSGIFIIPATSLPNTGQTTITINSITSTVTNCSVAVIGIATTVTLGTLPTPILVEDGNLFCEVNEPTIADLSSNIVDAQNVVWFNQASGGIAYNSTDLLVNGNTYYAAFVAGTGCESETRLEVIVDLTVCNDIIIPDGFSPNGDGINDDFEIANLVNAYPNYSIEIYNRYGNLIYTANRTKPNWNGTSSEGGLTIGNNLLPAGVYFYILYFNDGIRKPHQGRVYLSR
jgi:mucin-2